MKKDITKWIQHANAVVLIVFCVLYSLVQGGHFHIDDVIMGILVGGTAILFLYFTSIFKISGLSEEELRASEEALRDNMWASILCSWFIATLWLRMFLGYDSLMTYLALAFLFAFIVFGIYYLKKYRIILFPNKKMKE